MFGFAKKIFLFCLSLFYLFPDTGHSQPDPQLQTAIQLSIEKKLWQRPRWLNLLHYKKNTRDASSQIDDKTFFLSENGRHDPQAELIATLKAFYNNTPLADPHAQCRFPARLHWLRQQLGNALDDLPEINCPAYSQWRQTMPDARLSLIFPAYHLNSPSSMFGHTLLRIDPPEENKSSSWLSMAVNFGANIDEDDNSLVFAFRGLAGGYNGTFVIAPYYKKIKEYNRHENRDIWEYPLNLSSDETRFLVLHLWELRNIQFKYYFFDENCSYRLLELLEVARPELRLSDQFGLTAIPVDTVRSIQQAGLIRDVIYRPSQATGIHFFLRHLNPQQQTLVLAISQDAEQIQSEDFQQQKEKDQRLILDTAYRYLRYQQNEEGRSARNARNSYLILQAINQLPRFSSPTIPLNKHQQPENGHLSKRLALDVGSYDQQAYAQLQFRMAFHSLEDRIDGFLPGAQINSASLSIRAINQRLQIQQLDLVDIFSLTPRNRFFSPLSWRVYGGLEQQQVAADSILTGHITGGAGVSYEPWQDGILYSLATARLEANSRFQRALEPALGLDTGLLQHFSFGSARLSISGERFLNTEYRLRFNYTQNIVLARNHALQLSFRRQRQTESLLFSEAQLSYHYFF